MKAIDVMKSPVITVGPDDLVSDVVNILLERRISAVPVINDGGAVVGMVSEGDLIRRPELGTDQKVSRWLGFLTHHNSTPAEFLKTHARKVSEVMRKPVISVTPDDELNDVVATMESRGVKRVPVVENDRLVGIIARSDLLLALAHADPSASVRPHSDRELRLLILDATKHESWSRAALVNIMVTDGEVTIWGVMDDTNHQQALRRMIEEIPGVKTVEDCTRANLYYLS